MAERNYELIDYKEWLNKPNILVDVNRQTLSKLQAEAVNIMLHNVQIEIHKNRGKMDYRDFAVHDFCIKSNALKKLFNVSEGTTSAYIAKEMAKLNEIALKDYRDDGSFEAMVLFPNVKYDAVNFHVTFRVNTKISEFMYKKEKDYTRLDLHKIRQYNLGKHAFNLLEIIYKNIFRFRLNQYVEFSTEELKRLVGVSSECSNSYFKSKVIMKALKELECVVGIEVDFALNTSLSYNKIKSVRLYLDCTKPKNSEFIKECMCLDKKEDISKPDNFIPKATSVPTESRTIGINLLVSIMIDKLKEKQASNKVYDKKEIKKYLLSKNYEQYVTTMDKLGLTPIEEHYFVLGYRYFKYK